jgi:hypothetical protein
MRQVHGTRVAVVDGPGRGRDDTAPDDTAPDDTAPDDTGHGADHDGVDAMVTDRPGIALAVLAADCVPVLLADPGAGVVGAAHAGRVGAASGVLAATLEVMSRLGARPERTEVLLGPAVCGGCYEVPTAMRAEVAALLPGSGCRTTRGTAGLDLRAGLRTQLASLGVTRVDTDPRCTMEDRGLYSHRRDGRTGRLAAVTWLDRG